MINTLFLLVLPSSSSTSPENQIRVMFLRPAAHLPSIKYHQSRTCLWCPKNWAGFKCTTPGPELLLQCTRRHWWRAEPAGWFWHCVITRYNILFLLLTQFNLIGHPHPHSSPLILAPAIPPRPDFMNLVPEYIMPLPSSHSPPSTSPKTPLLPSSKGDYISHCWAITKLM